MRGTLMAVVLLAAMALAAPEARAEPGKPLPETVRIVAGQRDYPPFSHRDETGRLTGVCVEMFRAALKDLGISPEFLALPWSRGLRMLETGEVDGILPLFRTSEREGFLVFPEESFVNEENALFTRRGSGIDFDGDLEALRGLRIGVIKDYAYGPAFDGADFLTKEEVITEGKLVNLVLESRFPLGIGSPPVILHYAAMVEKQEEVVFLKPFLSSEPLFVGFSRAAGHEALSAAFSTALRRFKATPDYRELLRRFGF